jgi:hypothetical protein
MKIGAVANNAGIRPSAIRFYERAGSTPNPIPHRPHCRLRAIIFFCTPNVSNRPVAAVARPLRGICTNGRLALRLRRHSES